MKTITTFLFSFFTLLQTSIFFGQPDLNKVSIESSLVYLGAISPYNKGFKSNFSGLNHFDIGLRYMFTETLGAKASYKFDHFVNDPGGDLGIKYNTLSIGAVYNIGKQFGLTYLTRDRLGLLVNFDGGVAFAKGIDQYESEKIGIIGLGITPIYYISKRVALSASYIHNFTMKQHYGFDGFLLDPTFKDAKGSFYNFTFGIVYYLGENRYHSDWY